MGKNFSQKNKAAIITILLLVLFLNACEFGNNRLVEVQGHKRNVTIIEPEENSEWAIGTQIIIQSRVSAPEVIVGLTLFVNGQQDRPEDLFAHPTFTRGTIQQIWTVDQAGVYELQTLLRDGGGIARSNVVTVHVIDSSQTKITPSQESPFAGEITLHVTPTQTETLIPTITLTPTLTLTPESGKPEATANQNLNCRRGPSTEYQSLWYFMQGQTAPIEGRSSDSSWLVISRLDGGGQCWVSSYYIQTVGDIFSLPIITPPPLPPTDTPTVTPTITATLTEIPYSTCADYPDFSTCNDDPMGFGGCSWSTGLNVCEGP